MAKCLRCGAEAAWIEGRIPSGAQPKINDLEMRIEDVESQLAAANSEVERLRKENAELQARYATLANEASNASLHNAFE